MKTEIYLDGDFAIVGNQPCVSKLSDSRKITIAHTPTENFHQVQFVFDSEGCVIKDISYVFYGREFLLSDENCYYKCEYGYMYPFSMFGFMSKGKGITIIADSHKIGFIEIEKDDNKCCLTFGFEIYDDMAIDFLVYDHSSNIREGISAYHKWYKNKRGQLPKCADSAKDIFHVRRYFFNEELCPSAILGGGTVNLEEIYANDCEKLGGVDAGLFFDYAYDKATKIRCGNVNTIPFGDDLLCALRSQIENIRKKSSCKFFSYFDPYIVQDKSAMDSLYRDELPILRRDGKVSYIWDLKQWPPCVGTELWQNVSAEFIIEATEKLGCDGVYLDEVGNGNQYSCYNEKHNHPKGFSQFKAEREYILSLQNEIRGKLWMCEFPIADCEENYMDIVLSDTASLINIYRFIFPDIRFVRITGCDRPLGDNVWEINKSFFNGEGLWIDNDINNPVWYSEKVKTAIKKNYELFKKYQEFFTSDDVLPLYYVDESGVMANSFSYGGKTLLTFINPGEKEVTLKMKVDGISLIENLYPDFVIEGEGETFTIKLKSKSVGCAMFEKI